MKLRGICRLHQIANLLESRAIVLLYHRIAQFDPDPQLLCVSPAHFAEHLHHLQRSYRPISLRALGKASSKGSIPRNAAVVTFDDGFVDNLENALPLLRRYDVPATVFVASGYVDRNREFPSDALERCLFQQGTLPNSLTLEIGGKVHSWHVGDARADQRSWNIAMENDPTPRHRCYRELHSLLRPLGDESRQSVLDNLAAWASCSTDARSDRRAFSSDELRSLNGDGLIEVGAHGANHLVLASQPCEAQQYEIAESKQRLETIIGQPVSSFSYPYGGSDDVSDHTKALVKEAGFERACANVPGPVTPRSDLFWLPRILIRDWNGEEFADRLRRAAYG